MPRAFGLRIALYVLAIAFGLWLAGYGLLTIFWPEYLQALTDPEFRPPVLVTLLVEVLTAPLILAITAGFAAADRRTAADLGLCLPRAPGATRGSAAAAVRHAGVAVVGALVLLSGWRLVAGYFATFSQADTFPADEVESMGSWLPIDATGLVLFALCFLVLGLAGELMFRGYIYSVLRERLPWIHAAGLSSLFFALFQPTQAEVLAPSLFDLFLIGMLLAAVRERSGSLVLGTIFQATWNLYLGCMLAMPVSGTVLPRLAAVTVEGPLWVTGGTYGPEGSWLLTGFLLVSVLAATAWADQTANHGPDSSADGTADDAGRRTDD
jgi:membrane protease YdiL (CAAX protease family)